ncbi:MAG: hypothetical protein HQL48_08845 [Gammaproteobacteria bacterium]|nr:hypothetical protein [Gammaproteobacteria bacterium]
MGEKIMGIFSKTTACTQSFACRFKLAIILTVVLVALGVAVVIYKFNTAGGF